MAVSKRHSTDFAFEDTPVAGVYRECRYCPNILPHRYEFGIWLAIEHCAPCELQCLGGGVDAGCMAFHDNLCERCGKCFP